MASASLLKSYPVIDKSEFVKGQLLRQPASVHCSPNATPSPLTVRASSYADELVKTAKTVASPGRGILAMGESNATCGKRLASIGLENTEANRQAYRTLLVTAPGLGQYISGARRFGPRFSSTWLRTMCCFILLKPSMVTPGAESKDKATPEKVAGYTLKLLRQRIPPAVPGIMFLSGGQSEVEATLNLNAMNQAPNPWHVSFSYARALQKTWGGRPENVKAAQDTLLIRAKANSLAQLGKYTPDGESEEAKKELFVKGYSY